MSHRFTYRPGAASAVCAGDWAVLIGLPVSHPLVNSLYETLVQDPVMDTLTDLFAGSYGEFSDVVAIHATDPVHVFAWGACGFESTEGASLAGGPMGKAHRLTGLVGAWLGPAAVASSGMLPAGLGIFPASRIETVPVAPPVTDVTAAPVAPESAVAPVQSQTPSPLSPTPVAAQAPSPVVAWQPPFGAPQAAQFGAAAPPTAAAPPPRADSPYVPAAPPPMRATDRPRRYDYDESMPRLVALARQCAHGHLNPAYLEACSVCGEPLGGTPFEMPQRRLGRLVASTGGEVILDHDAVLGRNPSLQQGPSGEAIERVRISDPNKDVSNQHLLVRVTPTQVFVRDLDSTNGTELVRPGQPPVALAAGKEVAIELGTQVILAGAVTLTYEE